MSSSKLEVADYEDFGERVKAWAKGDVPLPQTIEEFTSQLAEANAGASLPSNFKRVEFVQGDEETLVVRLPAKSVLAHAEQGDGVTLPTFYHEAFGADPKVGSTTDFQSERMADFSIASCE